MDDRTEVQNGSASPVDRQRDVGSTQDAQADKPSTLVWHRLGLFLIGNLLPSFYLFVAARAIPNRPSWQTGEFRSYVALLLSGHGGSIFYPFLLYSIGSFSISIFWPQIASRIFFLRLGVATGIIISFQYCFLAYAAVMEVNQFQFRSFLFIVAIAIPVTVLVFVGIPFGIYRLVGFVSRRMHANSLTWRRLALIAAIPVIGAATGSLVPNATADLLLPYVVVLPGVVAAWAVPYWMLAAYSCQTLRLMRAVKFRGQVRLYQLLAIVSWLAAYFAAWRYSVTEALVAYSQLPKDPPNTCYVATAAARAHPWLAGSRFVTCRDGSTCRVTMQLAHLKCAEIVLSCIAPEIHRHIRRAYDHTGARFARYIHSPWSADLVYLGLKPAEWLARMVVGLAVPDAEQLARELYR